MTGLANRLVDYEYSYPILPVTMVAIVVLATQGYLTLALADRMADAGLLETTALDAVGLGIGFYEPIMIYLMYAAVSYRLTRALETYAELAQVGLGIAAIALLAWTAPIDGSVAGEFTTNLLAGYFAFALIIAIDSFLTPLGNRIGDTDDADDTVETTDTKPLRERYISGEISEAEYEREVEARIRETEPRPMEVEQ